MEEQVYNSESTADLKKKEEEKKMKLQSADSSFRMLTNNATNRKKSHKVHNDLDNKNFKVKKKRKENRNKMIRV